MPSMPAIPHQRMDILLGNPIIFTAFVRAEVSFCLDLLLSPTPPLPRLPGFRPFGLHCCPFVLVFSTKLAILFTFWSQKLNDLTHTVGTDTLTAICPPTLVIHSREDKSVPFAHAELNYPRRPQEYS